jgi:hypothetical protein
MPISVTHLWKQTPQDLHAIRENAQAAQAILAIPLIKRRARMQEYGYPRHLYKFRSIPRHEPDMSEQDKGLRRQFEDMLLHSELYAATVEKFNDPFDAQADYRIDESNVPIRDQIYEYLVAKGAPEGMARSMADAPEVGSHEALMAQMKENHQQVLSQLGICCLSATVRDPLLWGHYARGHSGVAVEYAPSLDPEALQAHEVEYSDEYPVITDFFSPSRRSLFPPLTRKSRSWKYEQEWRLFRAGEPNHTFAVRPEALTSVMMGLRISQPDRDYIEALMVERDRRFDLHTRLFQAEPSPGAYDVRFRRLR